jgi:broad specificity phosphatase PhoE
MIFFGRKMKTNILRLFLISFVVVLASSLPVSAQVTVILSRHAEKVAMPPKDPPLSTSGEERANLLASTLADAGVGAIFVTELQRTQQTAAPLAARVHVTPTVIPAADTNALVKAIRERQNGVVVVIGHSNTLPAIITALGGPAVKIDDNEYDNLFVLTLDGSKSSLLRLRVGDPSRAPAQDNEHTMAAPVK